MSLLKWLQSPKIREPTKPGLPSPSQATTEEEAVKITVANDAIEKLEDSPKASSGQKRKRGEYTSYSPQQRAKFARISEEIGVAKATQKISAELGKHVSETTIRSIRAGYRRKIKMNLEFKKFEKITELPHNPRGRPLKLGEQLDNNVKMFIRNLCLAGGVVNSTIVMAAARGLVEAHNRAMLSENGGNLEITRDYAHSLLLRMNMVKRKGTKTAKKLPENFEELKTDFLRKIKKCVKENDIPHELIINFDQTGLKVIPVSEWTLHEKGSKDCSIVGLDDKREITAVIGVSMTGDLLPPQLIYKGSTDRCHPTFKFPSEWNVTHTDSHWPNAETMIEYANEVLIPYCNKVRKAIGCSGRSKAHALAIFDVYKAHQDKDFIAVLHKNRIRTVFIPACTTEELQPCDHTVNGKLKSIIKEKFVEWYAAEVSNQVRKGIETDKVKVGLQISQVKHVHANWVLYAMDKLSHDKKCVSDGFRLTGITDALSD